MEDGKLIPHIIHYCWFGGNPLPKSAVQCIESWKKYCPGYEVREWNESNYDVHACPYVQEAYQTKKWAFVSDYARFDILYSYGGVYFDTDVELIRPIDDILLKGPFLGMEQPDTEKACVYVAPGLGMGAVAGHPIYHAILSEYKTKHFQNDDGTYNQTTIVKYTTDTLREYGLSDAQHVQCVDGIWIYPWDYFCPMKYQTGELAITSNTRSIHYYSATWLTKEEQAAHRLTIQASKQFGAGIGICIGRIYSFPHRVRMKVRQKGFWGAIQFAIQKVVSEIKGR